LDAAHISTLNCDEMAGDRPREPPYVWLRTLFNFLISWSVQGRLMRSIRLMNHIRLLPDEPNRRTRPFSLQVPIVCLNCEIMIRIF